jgi:hypothetical protein
MITRRLIEAMMAGQVADWSAERYKPDTHPQEAYTIFYKDEPLCGAATIEGRDSFILVGFVWRVDEFSKDTRDEQADYYVEFMLWLHTIEESLRERGAPAGILSNTKFLVERWVSELTDSRSPAEGKSDEGEDPQIKTVARWAQITIYKQMKRLDELHFGSAPEKE